MLAEVGLLSTILPFGAEATSYGRWVQREGPHRAVPGIEGSMPLQLCSF